MWLFITAVPWRDLMRNGLNPEKSVGGCGDRTHTKGNQIMKLALNYAKNISKKLFDPILPQFIIVSFNLIC